MNQREIKFKAKNVLTGKWEIYTLQDLIDGKAKGIALDNWRESTGLLDKSGKEVYRGDIVKRFRRGKYTKAITGEIKWNFSNFQWRFFRYRNFSQPLKSNFSCKIIGNIYDDPNLLTINSNR